MAPPHPQHSRGRAHRVRIRQTVHARECWAAAQTLWGCTALHPSCWHGLCFPVTQRGQPAIPLALCSVSKQLEDQEHGESRVTSREKEVSSAMWGVHLAALHTKDSINTVVWGFWGVVRFFYFFVCQFLPITDLCICPGSGLDRVTFCSSGEQLDVNCMLCCSNRFYCSLLHCCF